MNSPGPTPPQALPSNAAVSSFPSIQTELNNSNCYSNGYGGPGSDLQTPKPPHHDDKDDEANAQEVTWWGSSSYGDVGRTPTATRFVQAGDGYGGTDSNGYFSPMANQTFATRSPATPSTPSRQTSSYQDDDDDLGLGNNAYKKKREATPVDGEDTKSHHTPVPEEKKKEGVFKIQVGFSLNVYLINPQRLNFLKRNLPGGSLVGGGATTLREDR
jgi:hypothetical protein